MIAPGKVQPALQAIHRLLVYARLRANERATPEEMAELLDDAEYLPALMLEPGNDRTEDFRHYLEGIVAQNPRVSQALIDFGPVLQKRVAS